MNRLNNDLLRSIAQKDKAGVEKLLNKGADVNQGDEEEGQTPLISAVTEGDKEIAEILLRNGADVNGRDLDGWCALMWAAELNRNEIVLFLLDNGADINM